MSSATSPFPTSQITRVDPLLSRSETSLSAIFVASLLAFLSGVYEHDPWKTYLITLNQDNIILLGWGEAVLRGLGSNWLVCLAFVFSISAEDVNSRVWATFWPVMCSAVVAFEHSIANMFLLSLSYMVLAKHNTDTAFSLPQYAHADFHYGHFIGKNLIPVTVKNQSICSQCVSNPTFSQVGNFAAALVIVGVSQFVCFGLVHTSDPLKPKMLLSVPSASGNSRDAAQSSDYIDHAPPPPPAPVRANEYSPPAASLRPAPLPSRSADYNAPQMGVSTFVQEFPHQQAPPFPKEWVEPTDLNRQWVPVARVGIPENLPENLANGSKR